MTVLPTSVVSAPEAISTKNVSPEARSGLAAPPASAPRILVLDPLRGLAAAAVMWYHFSRRPWLIEDGGRLGAFFEASGSKGWLGVEVFFVISGFVLPYAMWRGRYRLRSYGRFLIKRLLRLEPPYLVTLALTVGLWLVGPLVPGFRGEAFTFHWPQFLSHFGYLNAFTGYAWYNPVFWTLAIEFQFYLLIALVFPLAVHNHLGVRAAVPAILAALVFLPTPPSLVFHFLPLFALGIATMQRVTGLLPLGVYALLFVGASAVAVFGIGHEQAFVGVMAAVLIATLSRASPDSPAGRVLEWKPLLWLGSVSYSLYLVHVPIGGRVINLGQRFIGGPLSQALLLSVAIAVSLVATAILYRLVERPAQRWSSRLRYTKPTPEAAPASVPEPVRTSQ